MVLVRRLTFTNARVKTLKKDLTAGKKLPPWAQDAKIQNGDLYIGPLQVIPREDIDSYLRTRVYSQTKDPVPFSRDGGFDYLTKRTLGISRKRWYDWLSKQEIHQKQSARPVAPKRAGQRVTRRGLLQMDLVEGKPQDLKSLGRTLPTYFFTLVDLLTGYFVVRESKTKEAKKIAKLLAGMLDEMQRALGKKVYAIQSDHGSEFKAETLKLMQGRGIKWVGVRLGARIEQMNAYFQKVIYSHMRQGRKGKLQSYINSAVKQINENKSRITGFSAADAVKQTDLVLAKAFNAPGKRAQPGKSSRVVKLVKGDTVLVLTKAKKGSLEFKSYRAKHYSEPKKVIGRRGPAYQVTGGNYYTRDRLLKVPEVDTKSKKLLAARGPQKQTKEDRTAHRKTASEKMKALKAKARIAPRRGKRRRT